MLPCSKSLIFGAGFRSVIVLNRPALHGEPHMLKIDAISFVMLSKRGSCRSWLGPPPVCKLRIDQHALVRPAGML